MGMSNIIIFGPLDSENPYPVHDVFIEVINFFNKYRVISLTQVMDVSNTNYNGSEMNQVKD